MSIEVIDKACSSRAYLKDTTQPSDNPDESWLLMEIPKFMKGLKKLHILMSLTRIGEAKALLGRA